MEEKENIVILVMKDFEFSKKKHLKISIENF